MKYFFPLIISLVALLFTSCNNEEDEECVGSRPAYVTEVDAPATGEVNEPVLIEVDFQVTSGCGQFGKFIETSNGNMHTIEVEARYVGCICTADAPIRTTQYEFTAEEPGVHTLRFKSGDTEFIDVVIDIGA